MLGIIGKSADLSGSNSTLATQDPSVGTTYSARSDRGLKSDDSVTVAADQSQVNAAFSFDMALCQIKTDAARPLSA